MDNYLQVGNMITLPAAPAAVEGGWVVVAGSLVGVAADDAAMGEEVVIQTTGVFALDKVVGETFAIGAPVYYDTAVHAATSSATGTTRIGVSIKPAAGSDLTVEVRLSGAW